MIVAAKRTRPVRFLRSSDYRGHWNYYQYLAARYKARDSTNMLENSIHTRLKALQRRAHAGVIVKFNLPATQPAYDAPAMAFCKFTHVVF